MSGIRSLYVHIPFCERKCEYCDFASVGGLGGVDEYIDALVEDLNAVAPAAAGDTIETIFFGGGTPGLIDPLLIDRLMATVRDLYTLSHTVEATIEANPSSVSAHRAEQWLAAGFTRISMGVQSLHAPSLTFLGRVHDADRALAAVREVRAAGARNISCDLIYAVPGLSDRDWRNTLHAVIDSGPDHISAYELTVEPGTPLHASVRKGKVIPVADDNALRQHWIAVDALAAAGYEQYEVSSFARAGKECMHNLAYWHNDFYLAAGVGAHGHLPAYRAQRIGINAVDGAAVRYWNTRKLHRYITGERREGSETLSDYDHARERLLMGLRLVDGVDVDTETCVRAAPLAEAGLVVINTGHIRVTRRGQDLLNEVIARLAA